MILLALTGIIYLFKPQLDPLMYGNLLKVEPGHHRISADEQLQRIHATYPQGRIKQYLPPADAGRSAQFVVIQDGRELNVFIDPYRGNVLGEQDAKLNLQAVARALHGELMIGTVGDRLVELAAGWGVMLVVSGVYLWWPRGRSSGGVLWPRLNTRGRLLWRDLHAVSGFWGSILLLLMLLSGMTWTGFWGKQYAEVWNRFPDPMWNNMPKSDVEARSLNSAARQTVPWAVENTPMPMSGDHAEHMQHGAASAGPAAPGIALQQVVDIATARQIEPGYSITLPTTAEGVFTIAVFADDPRNDATLHVDQGRCALAAIRQCRPSHRDGGDAARGQTLRADQPDRDPADLPDDTAWLDQRPGHVVETPATGQPRRSAAASRPATLEERDAGHAGAGGAVPAGGGVTDRGLAVRQAAIVAPGPAT